MSVEEEIQELRKEVAELKRILNDVNVKADQTMTLIRPAIDKLEQM